MRKYLIVVDMQSDFIDGALGTAEGVRILPAVAERIQAARAAGEAVLFTRDTHQPNYMETQEGKNLPVPHCIEGTDGWQIHPALRELAEGCLTVDKPTFGSMVLAQHLKEAGDVEAVTLIGVCTDICVISNALLIKAALPEVPVAVEAACCAGVTPQSHDNALAAMKMCQVEVR